MINLLFQKKKYLFNLILIYLFLQPIEVIRVEMQSQVKAPGRPEKMSIVTCAKYIYQNNGFKGFFRGVTPRIGLGIWQTICMVFGGDAVKVN